MTAYGSHWYAVLDGAVNTIIFIALIAALCSTIYFLVMFVKDCKRKARRRARRLAGEQDDYFGDSLKILWRQNNG